MQRFQIHLNEDQITSLKSLEELSLAEHIRRAVDEYIASHRTLRVTLSPSKHGKEKRTGN